MCSWVTEVSNAWMQIASALDVLDKIIPQMGQFELAPYLFNLPVQLVSIVWMMVIMPHCVGQN